MSTPPLYAPLRSAIAATLGVFFRRIQVVGEEQVPETGPVLFVGNHPNSLLDPAALIAVSHRPIAFAAKDVLFANPALRPILRGVGALPIRRRVDSDGKVDDATAAAASTAASVDNSGAFAAMHAQLEAGGAIGVFPEGLSHDEAQLQPLKTGAARVALGTKGAPVRIVPVGLNYSSPKRFRSNVLVRFGPPILVDEAWRARAAIDLHGTARALTLRIDLALRALTINADDWDTLRVLETVRRLYQPPGLSLEARVELGQRFAAGYEKLRGQPEISGLFDRVRRFRNRLDAIDLTERDLQTDWRLTAVFARFWRRSGRALLWLPLAIPGLLLHAPAALLAAAVGAIATPRRDVVATTKLLAGFVLVVATWIGLSVAMVLAWGSRAAMLMPLLPLSGWAALRVIERYADGRELLGSLWNFLRFRQEVADLRRERRRLEAAVVGAVVRFLPADLEPLFLAASVERLGDAASPGSAAGLSVLDGEVASAALDAQGVDDADADAWLRVFADLLGHSTPPVATANANDDASAPE
jgi:glycerol-3-phosphate O-acyltransferase / dihydroxyacetone phosphate acyltransferase